jgi:hypothetical protein
MRYRAVSQFVQNTVVPLQEIHDLTNRFLEIADWETGDLEEARRVELIIRYLRENALEVAGYDADLYCYKLHHERIGADSYAWYTRPEDAPKDAVPMNFFDDPAPNLIEDLGPKLLTVIA